jgi:hypothetical protein
MNGFVELLKVLFSPRMFDEPLEYALEIRLNWKHTNEAY